VPGKALQDVLVAVVVPCLNEASQIVALVQSISVPGAAVVVVDGGSTDATVPLARQAGAIVIDAPAGRASQMNAGATEALSSESVRYLLFLHADVAFAPVAGGGPAGSVHLCRWVESLGLSGRAWGRFDVQLTTQGTILYERVMLRIIGQMMNWRSRLTGICTGDQGLLIERQLFEEVGGFAAIPLMEDIDISARLKRMAGRPASLQPPLIVSSRRWMQRGIWRTIVSMWWFRLRYFFGTSAEQLHDAYYGRAR
jgi:rSAM/selenodomain-associated transferase 2